MGRQVEPSRRMLGQVVDQPGQKHTVNITPSRILRTAPSHVLCSGLVTRPDSASEVSSALDRAVATVVRTTSGNDLGVPATLGQPTADLVGGT